MTRRLLTGIVITLALALVVADVFFGPTESRDSTASLDDSLRKVVMEYNLRPIQVRRFDADPKFRLGQALFFDPLLSGTRDVSCATCHSLMYGTSDSLPRSIGVHGVGTGPDRKLLRGEAIHPRNALDLWNRDNNAVKALFWDGRVEVLDPVHRVFRSPLGGGLPSGLQNALAVQALFPLVTPDEMLGSGNDRSSSGLSRDHADLPNDLVPSGAR
jgi:cytochrome c peroxidase